MQLTYLPQIYRFSYLNDIGPVWGKALGASGVWGWGCVGEIYGDG